MFFSAKAILEFFQLFYSNFNPVHYASKKLYIYDDNKVNVLVLGHVPESGQSQSFPTFVK